MGLDHPQQGDIWWAEAEDKHRPVLIITRSEAIPVLSRVLVAPITRTIRGIPTEITLNTTHGLKYECVATFDNLHPVPRDLLTRKIGRLNQTESRGICKALAALADCRILRQH